MEPPEMSRQRVIAVGLVLAVLGGGVAASVGSIDTCLKPSQGPELYGPTAMTAQTANQGLAVGLNHEGTVTVFKWPRPSFYDQVKYHTRDRDALLEGTYRNTGAFLGIAVTRDGHRRMHWLRTFDASQEYVNGSDAVITRYTDPTVPVNVTVRDIVAADRDALVRNITVTAGDSVTDARLIAFANMNLATSKHRRFPTADWCTEHTNTETARYLVGQDSILSTTAGTDRSTGQQRSVAVTMAFRGDSDGHQVGGDRLEPGAYWPGCLSVPGVGRACLPLIHHGSPQDAFIDAEDGRLSGSNRYRGQTTAALAQDLAVGDGKAHARLTMAAGPDPATARRTRQAVQDRSYPAIASEKAAWIAEMIDAAPLPATDDSLIRSMARRSLILLMTSYDRRSGAIVASIATQGPYGADWPRDGAYFNYVMDRYLRQHDRVREHNLWYASIQQREQGGPLDPPPGAWAMNYYADGVVAGPIPWEIDEVGYGAWTLWDHYAVTGNRSYLQEVYPAIRAAGDLLVRCRGSDGLQCRAFEDDTVPPKQTILGSSTTLLGLRSAARAAAALDRTQDARRYRDRITELMDAVQEAYTTGTGSDRRLDVGPVRDAPELLWPTCLHQRLDASFRDYEQSLRRGLRYSINGSHDGGLYEEKEIVAMGLLRPRTAAINGTMREGLDWLAQQVATPQTHVLGEVWFRRDGEIRTGMSRPHLWSHALFYLASLSAYPPANTTVPGCRAGMPT